MAQTRSKLDGHGARERHGRDGNYGELVLV
jgi:hypothetical protein